MLTLTRPCALPYGCLNIRCSEVGETLHNGKVTKINPVQNLVDAIAFRFSEGCYRKLEDLLSVISHSRLQLKLNLTNVAWERISPGKVDLLQTGKDL